MRIKNLGEFSLIERLAKDIKTSARVIAGIGDDAAVLRYARDKYLLFTSDMLVEGRHFHKKTDPYLVGKKSLSVNISDIAAMGGVPRFAVVSLGVPPSLDLKYVDALYK
ncbi:MAG: thiamine-phosphate kinase, partial [Candidatus Omnitrophica bacterium]|nr:thiamine-phosphate kinase [Candidatus Omnitrophota bacterium]